MGPSICPVSVSGSLLARGRVCYDLQPLDPTPQKGNPGTVATLTHAHSKNHMITHVTSVHDHVVVNTGATVSIVED